MEGSENFREDVSCRHGPYERHGNGFSSEHHTPALVVAAELVVGAAAVSNALSVHGTSGVDRPQVVDGAYARQSLDVYRVEVAGKASKATVNDHPESGGVKCTPGFVGVEPAESQSRLARIAAEVWTEFAFDYGGVESD